MQIKSYATPAEQFHQQVGDWLKNFSYSLVNEPEIEHTQFQASLATYRSINDLYLHVAFDPVDGNFALISFGRYWRSENGWFRLSNSYAVFAKRLGLEVPKFYKLGYGAEVAVTIKKIWGDLQDTLEVITSNTTADVLASVEEDQYGARQVAIGQFGSDFEKQVEVSPFPPTQ
jgi:hypothetical protein